MCVSSPLWRRATRAQRVIYSYLCSSRRRREGTDLCELSVVEQSDSLTERVERVGRVRRENAAERLLFLSLQQPLCRNRVPDEPSRFGVQSGCRLVQHEHFRTAHDAHQVRHLRNTDRYIRIFMGFHYFCRSFLKSISRSVLAYLLFYNKHETRLQN